MSADQPTKPLSCCVGMSAAWSRLLFGIVLTVVFVVLGSVIQIPYVALGPGSTINTLGTYDCGTVGSQPIFDVQRRRRPGGRRRGAPAPASHLNMTTISVTDGMTLFGALGLWITGNYALVPREEQFPPDKTVGRGPRGEREAVHRLPVGVRDRRVALAQPQRPELKGNSPRSPTSAASRRDRRASTCSIRKTGSSRLDGTPVTTLDSLRGALSTTLPGQVAR